MTESRSPSHADLLDEVRGALSASRPGEEGLRVGLEVEVVPLGPDGRRLPLTAPDPDALSSRTLVDVLAREEGWSCRESADGTRAWYGPDGASVTFEPGGQLEVRTVASRSPGATVRSARGALGLLHAAAADRGIRLLARGMDPETDAEAVPLGLTSPRYRRQLRHYATVGPWGRRMMLNSAAVHVNVDLGGRAVRRWAVANRMAPYLTAIFANSPRAAGVEPGLRSARAEQWRHLDPSRTGVFGDESDPAREYLAFAMAARDFLGAPDEEEARPFRASWEAGADLAAWRAHLTTLFPEVRPRRYLEIRSVDALPAVWLPAPVVLVTGVLYDPVALREAHRLLPPADAARLAAAGRSGLGDPELADTALQLFDLALEGAARQARDRDTGDAVEVARAFRARFTARGEDPGHEPDDLDPFQR